MPERKPSDVGFDSWVDQQIREAADRGEFDNLPGAGKPLTGLDDADDELWWVKNYLRREGLPTEVLLPTALQLRKEIERLPDTVRELPDEQAVRDVVRELNLRIAAWLRAPSGPCLPVGPVTADNVVQQWRADRRASTGRTATDGADPSATTGEPPPRRVRWWHRIAARHRTS